MDPRVILKANGVMKPDFADYLKKPKNAEHCISLKYLRATEADRAEAVLIKAVEAGQLVSVTRRDIAASKENPWPNTRFHVCF